MAMAPWNVLGPGFNSLKCSPAHFPTPFGNVSHPSGQGAGELSPWVSFGFKYWAETWAARHLAQGLSFPFCTSRRAGLGLHMGEGGEQLS